MRRLFPCFLLMGCGLVQGASPSPGSSLEGTCWQLTGAVLGGHLAKLHLPAPTLSFRGTLASGQTGCNTFSSTVWSAGQRLTLGPVRVTRRACTDALRQAQEGWYLNTLRRVTHVDINGEQLILHSGPEDRLIFRARETNLSVTNLQGDWSVTRLRVAGRALPIAAPATLTFSGGQTASGTQEPHPALNFTGATGCNRIFGTVQASGRLVTFSTVGTTRMTCDPARNAQEAALVEVLNHPLTLTPIANGWRLKGQGGELELRRATQATDWSGDPRPGRLNGAAFVPTGETKTLKVRSQTLTGPDR
ncbi:META domain-containing protein [Deinococcus navajonensis]|uniref:META domain-containing protein n=1 Tax=Deinococcus navajonensis TaxID=309884 RepID=A0ABV8XRW4_9DEIO